MSYLVEPQNSMQIGASAFLKIYVINFCPVLHFGEFYYCTYIYAIDMACWVAILNYDVIRCGNFDENLVQVIHSLYNTSKSAVLISATCPDFQNNNAAEPK